MEIEEFFIIMVLTAQQQRNYNSISITTPATIPLIKASERKPKGKRNQ